MFKKKNKEIKKIDYVNNGIESIDNILKQSILLSNSFSSKLITVNFQMYFKCYRCFALHMIKKSKINGSIEIMWVFVRKMIYLFVKNVI